MQLCGAGFFNFSVFSAFLVNTVYLYTLHDMHTADLVAEMLIIMASNEKKYELPLQVIKSRQMGLNL